ncbi:diguanylate cyclase [Celeribacter litoreus]|uniref:diguanylate cyclase n=1 Tax=Celeribacter litoreus TaxID=2876714 RepID=UPI001CCB70FC|nr:diguanylate cyclase [Celeribacter litoreus]MCA0042996.1 diguanylate cyclase [Celeribacter litoreus]
MAGRILIADNVPTNRIILKVKLAAAFYDVSQAASGAEVIERAESERPNLIILDLTLGDMSGLEACSRLKSNPVTAHIPVVIIIPAIDSEAKISALKAGADEFLIKPIDDLTLTARVRALVRASATSDELRRRMETARALGFSEAPRAFETAGRIMLIGHNTEEAMMWRAGLKGLIHDEIILEKANRALERVSKGETADVYVISARASRREGLRLISDLRAREAARNAGIIVVHDQRHRREALMALDLGANDLIPHGADPEEMVLRLRMQLRRKRESDMLQRTVDEGLKLATQDSLTGLSNRRYAMPHLERIAREARTRNQPFALMLIDLDRFKSVNDRYGHSTGDAVLIEVAHRLRDNLRGMDLIARFGGEEFLVCLPCTTLMEARAVAERLRNEIFAIPVAHAPDGTPVSVSASIGLVMGDALPDSSPAPIAHLIEVADRALYVAKAEGRNQVTLGPYAA